MTPLKSVYYKKTNYMRLRLLLTLGLVLSMATIASSNECLRCRKTEVKPTPASSVIVENTTLLVNKLLII